MYTIVSRTACADLAQLYVHVHVQLSALTALPHIQSRHSAAALYTAMIKRLLAILNFFLVLKLHSQLGC